MGEKIKVLEVGRQSEGGPTPAAEPAAEECKTVLTATALEPRTITARMQPS
jgi:hypothetical protein